jgi:hypothetical protein
VRHKEDPNLTIGLPQDFTTEYENHILRFERYFTLPPELRVLRDKIKKEAMKDGKKW